MSITAIALQNFKGIGDEVRVDLKPITLLFGANSSGKSTIVQAIHYAREILERQNLNPDYTLYGGEVIELGGFKNFVHNRDLNLPIVMRFYLDLEKIDLPGYGTLHKNTELSQRIKSVWLELTICWNKSKNQPVMTSHKVAINDNEIAKLFTSGDEVKPAVFLNLTHPLYANNSGSKPEWQEIFIEDLSSALPPLDKLYKVQQDEDRIALDFDLDLIFNQLVLGPSKVLNGIIQHFRHLGPFRKIPPRNYEVVLSKNEADWADGSAAWHTLYRKNPALLKEVSRWMGDRLNTGYSLFMKNYHETPIAEIKNVNASLDKMPIRHRLMLLETMTGLEMLPQDVGIGFSQVLPVVVAALDSDASIIAIEQPELHIHPAIQVELGDLFIQQISHGDQIFVLETHSEHLMLRLLRRIGETTEDALPTHAFPLQPNQVAVIHVEQTEKGIRLKPIRIDKTGEFIDRWPQGFFGERSDELFY